MAERRRRAGRALILVIATVIGAIAVGGADAAPGDARGGSDAATSVGILSAGANSTDVRVVADMAEVLDNPRLRIVPIIGHGGIRNVEDLLNLPVADVAIVQSDVLTALGEDQSRQGVMDKLVYIAKLFNEEVHVLARKEIGSLADLANRTVAVGPADGGSSVTAGVLFSALSIPIRPVFEAPAAAMAKLQAGEIDAIVYVAGKPAPLMSEPGNATAGGQGLHFLKIPVNERLLAAYVPSALGHGDYPDLIASGETVETISVPMVMVAAAGRAAQGGYLNAFVDAFFGNFAQLQEPQRNPKWREVNLAATVPGLRRLPASVDWVRTNMATPEERKLQEAFADILRFLKEQNIKPDVKQSDQDMKALFWRFVDWRAAQTQP
ncbi:MAG: hypothetical protein JNM75_00270 [Rhodospirillales bacterium]|nr:hypothetical protein [Rhodospirillales bacterium]